MTAAPHTAREKLRSQSGLAALEHALDFILSRKRMAGRLCGGGPRAGTLSLMWPVPGPGGRRIRNLEA